MKSIKNIFVECSLRFCLGASWGIFVLWMLFPPFRLFDFFLLNRISCSIFAMLLVFACYYSLRKYAIRNNK
ncbi:hypothetical protein [Campylobacter sp.]|uniref:hypothetical protein n=1 Tax=Campylobacter sp. TaxID=205 RepID=UPI002AA813A9|nr:hypothetical protein [Campylobacter sp.]